MTGIIGPLVGAGASIAAGLFGSDAAKKAGKTGKKMAKKQEALAKEQLAAVDPQYQQDLATQKGALDAQLAAASTSKAETNRLLAANQARENAMLAAERGRAEAEFSPYTDYGKASLAARAGLYGESPEAAAGFIDRFQASPTYQLNYRSMVDEGAKALERSRAAAGGLNTGRTLTGLSENAGTVSNRLLGQYVGDINQGVNWGLDAAGRLVDAQGRILNAGLASTQFYSGAGANAAQNYANAVRADQGAYAINTAQLGQNRLNNLGSARGAQAQAYANRAAAAAGQAAGQTAAWNSAAQGVGQAFGNSQYFNPGNTYGQQGQNPYATRGPTNIVPPGYVA